MAGSRIKGITVEIGGDTTKLQTALKGVNHRNRKILQIHTDRGAAMCGMRQPLPARHLDRAREEENRLAVHQSSGLWNETLQGLHYRRGRSPARSGCPRVKPLSRGGRVHIPDAHESHHWRSYRHKWRFRGNRPADPPHCRNSREHPQGRFPAGAAGGNSEHHRRAQCE